MNGESWLIAQYGALGSFVIIAFLLIRWVIKGYDAMRQENKAVVDAWMKTAADQNIMLNNHLTTQLNQGREMVEALSEFNQHFAEMNKALDVHCTGSLDAHKDILKELTDIKESGIKIK